MNKKIITNIEASALGFKEKPYRKWPDDKNLIVLTINGWDDLFFDREGTLVYLTTLNKHESRNS
jgi:hypothetical protein